MAAAGKTSPGGKMRISGKNPFQNWEGFFSAASFSGKKPFPKLSAGKKPFLKLSAEKTPASWSEVHQRTLSAGKAPGNSGKNPQSYIYIYRK